MLERYSYTAHKVNLDGTLSNKEFLDSAHEFEVYMLTRARKFATIQVVRSDGKGIVYTDNGQDWEIIRRFTQEV